MAFDYFSNSKHILKFFKSVGEMIQFIDTTISQDNKYIENFVWTFLSEIFKVRFHHGRLNVNQVSSDCLQLL